VLRTITEDEAPKFAETLRKILEELGESSGFEIKGKLTISVARNLDTLAIIKGNRIYVSSRAARYPKSVLRYIVSHEIAHIVTRQHRKKFWETVARIYPKYELSRKTLRLLEIQARQSK
jgi:Protein of unknown function DUF45